MEDEGYILSAWGEISLSNIDFLPGPAGALTPDRIYHRRKINKKSDKRSRPQIRRVWPPAPAKARVHKLETIFSPLKQGPVKEKLKVAPDTTSSGSPCSETQIVTHGSQSMQLITTGDAEIVKPDSHDVVENRQLVRGDDGERQCGNVIGLSAGVVTNEKPKQGGLPKRPPIPRWDDDNQGSQ
ncbi:hypothetical protein CPB84DRAFT_933057 [Gymnopilus junonius]|uniref:Uncharacterized protein n=1 Tax=Gymnopilus junonius TaxID=109634 RepID=A0A9P5TTP2_GYMJU|nr:hypothetical protein CPB84DRAFT_933057 [Gymnopilus junonius]